MATDDANKQAILARRARYIAMAVAGVSTATSATACVCLSPVSRYDAGGDANAPTDAAPRTEVDAQPAVDGGTTADANTGTDAP